MKIISYLAFNGQCDEAFQFYEKVLGGKILMKMTYGDAPAGTPTPSPEAKNRIMHVTLAVGDQLLQGADAPGQHFSKPQGFCVMLSVDDAAEAERIFQALAENGQVQMPMQETFWAKRFGMLIDRFSIPFMVNCNKPMENPAPAK